MVTPLETYKTQYDSSQERQNALKWQNATISDIAKKYGFDFSKGYADQQANVAADTQRNAYNAQSRDNTTLNAQTLRDINSSLKEGVVNTEDNFFQQYLQQRQNQANRGLNSGLQADQNLRLGMNQQKQLAGLYRDATNAKSKEADRYNNETQRISEAMAQVEKERQANAQKLYQDMLTQGYGLLGQERSWFNTLDQQRYGQYQDMIDNWYKEQDLALQKQAAARAAASRAASKSSAASSNAQSNLAQQYQNYQATKAAQGANPIDQYVSNISAIENWRKTLSPTVSNAVKNNSLSPANSSLSAWEKMKMLGL